MTVDTGTTDRLRTAFERNFEKGLEVGAAVSLWQDGREVFSACQGWRDAARRIPWTPDTLVLIWSATKGLSSAAVLHALDQAELDLTTPVAEIWPEFAKSGKDRITVGEVLAHRSGLSALEDLRPTMFDHDAVVGAIENQAPLWEDRTLHGYGPRTYGFLADEIVRRLTGESLGFYWREEFGERMELDLWIGLPVVLHPCVADILVPRAERNGDDFSRAMSDPNSLTRRAFSTPSGLLSPSAMNNPALRSASLPSLGGIGSATSLAKFYGMLAAGGGWGRSYFSQRALGWMTTMLTQGFDQTLCTQTAFSAGYMKDPVDATGSKLRQTFGPSHSAFGHPGAGGSLAFADPDNRIGFAYVMNQMEAGVLPQSRALSLVQAVYGG